MSIGLIGTKIGMTREFMDTGQSVPVTVIKVEKGRVLDIINEDKSVIEDLIVAAHNNAKSELKTKTKEEISKIAGGFGISGFKWPI